MIRIKVLNVAFKSNYHTANSTLIIYSLENLEAISNSLLIICCYFEFLMKPRNEFLLLSFPFFFSNYWNWNYMNNLVYKIYTNITCLNFTVCHVLENIYFKAMLNASTEYLSTSFFLEGFVASCVTDDKAFYCSGFPPLLDLFVLNQLIQESICLRNKLINKGVANKSNMKLENLLYEFTEIFIKFQIISPQKSSCPHVRKCFLTDNSMDVKNSCCFNFEMVLLNIMQFWQNG